MSASLLSPMPAAAQDDATRLRKLEAEVRALQRKVFPGADGKYFEPQITPAQPGPAPALAPSTGPVTDLLTRMDSVETALSQLTAQTEVNQNALRLLSARLETLEAKARAYEAPMPVEPDGGIGDGTPLAAKPSPKPATPGSAAQSAAAKAPVKPAAASATSSTGAVASGAVERPNTGDAGDDAYVYGYRLWEAGEFVAAQKQLVAMLGKYPAHSRATYARNLLGRAYLDNGKPREAAEAFLKNYLDNRGGARAPDSLVYLSIATLKLGNKAKACEALEEFRLVYPNEAAGRLANLSSETAGKAGCK
ncbi:hypothetical protein EKN06_06235 [Croceicoccus ponticola]|uniref:Tetratricopeptide repeat protein n=2 Tax=Croceicoccus ponticola TaxID=2217664 RepID=A0A437GYT3_9SPHN|nr:hypothetical protein EKN06_06235 [Croceicoccus ponticola]